MSSRITDKTQKKFILIAFLCLVVAIIWVISAEINKQDNLTDPRFVFFSIIETFMISSLFYLGFKIKNKK